MGEAMSACVKKGKKERIRQYYFAKDHGCQEMLDELLWRMARLKELYATGKQRY